MKVAIIYNKEASKVINKFGMQNKEVYNPKTIKKVADSLEANGHNVSIIDGDMNVIERIHDFMPKVMEGEKMGMVFNMAYGIQGESRYTHIPSMLEMLGIPYVGSNPSGHALALDKVITKIILQKHNLPTPDFWVFNDDNVEKEEVKFPVIVKPKMESVSFGLKVVHNYEDLKEAVQFIISEFSQAALVEAFIPGREFCVGLLGNNPIETFPVLEIDLSGDPNAIQTFENKTLTHKGKICPAKLSDEQTEEMQRLSREAFSALQLRDFARVDFRMDEQGNIFILELNSMASLGATGSYPFAANVAGYNYKALVNRMLDVAALRYFTSQEYADNDAAYKKVPAEVKIRGFLRGRQNNIEKLLKDLVNVNTYVRNVEGVNQLSNLIKNNLSVMGFSHQAFPQVEVGNSHFFSNTDSDNYDILFIANLDNDAKRANHEYFQESEQKLYGTGIWENKGGIAVMLAALQSLRFIRSLRKIKIGILLTCDDTLQGKYTHELLQRISLKSKHVIGLHGAFTDGGVVTSRSGSAVYHFNMKLSNNKDAADVAKATGILSKLLSDWSDLSDPENGLVIAPTKCIIESNITEPYAHSEITLSMRFNDKNQFDEITPKIKKLVLPKYKKLMDIQFEGGIRRPSMHKTEKVGEFLDKIKIIANRLDVNLREEHRWSSADICYVDESIKMIDGIGPAGAKPNNNTEFILRHSLLERAALIAVLALEIGFEQK